MWIHSGRMRTSNGSRRHVFSVRRGPPLDRGNGFQPDRNGASPVVISESVCVCVHVNVDSRRLGKNKQKCDVAELEEALSCFFVLCCFFSFFLGRKKVRNSKHTV